MNIYIHIHDLFSFVEQKADVDVDLKNKGHLKVIDLTKEYY